MRPQALARWVGEIGKWGGGPGALLCGPEDGRHARNQHGGGFRQALSSLAWPLDMVPVLLLPPVLARQDACIFN